jgi:CubicO group peptidase (beta-lactamase class C family)
LRLESRSLTENGLDRKGIHSLVDRSDFLNLKNKRYPEISMINRLLVCIVVLCMTFTNNSFGKETTPSDGQEIRNISERLGTALESKDCDAIMLHYLLGERLAVKELRTLDGKQVAVSELEEFINRTLEKANVAGLSCAIINDSQVVYRQSFGFKNKKVGSHNDKETIFSAASFSKPVFAYLVMLLAEEGVIDLDKPLHLYLEKPLPEYPAYADLKGDERYKQITARMVLSHTTGFPNWRFFTQDGKLKFVFPPGTRHSYSGEGIVLLQMVIEKITGKDLETLAREKIFRPLGMKRSGYVWQEAFENNVASPHDQYGRQRGAQIRRDKPDAAGSMVTTAGDYARFIVGLLNAKGRRKASVDELLRPHVAIAYKNMFGPGAGQGTTENQGIKLAWGLGWGRFDTPYGRAFFHTGHDNGWQNYTVTYADKGIGIVLLSNSDNFESVAKEIVAKAIGDVYSPFGWLGYPAFDSSRANRPPPPDPVAIDMDPKVLATYAGTYDMKPTTTFHIKFEGDSLSILDRDGKSWVRLHSESETRFFIKGEEDYRFVFVRSDSGGVTGLQLEYQGTGLPLAKKVVSGQ